VVSIDAQSRIQHVLLGDALESATELAAFVLDEHGRYIAVNDLASELAGYARDEIVGVEIGSFNPHLAAEYADVMRSGRRGGTTFLVRRNGERVDIAYRVSRTTVTGLPFLVVLCWPVDS
jgi:PAS domain S-box-containing protein